MKQVHVGIDVGTTNIAVMAIDLDVKEPLYVASEPNYRLASSEPYAFVQDPHRIEATVYRLLAPIQNPIASICVTGQVHGILYYDDKGEAVSPLYTWLDQRTMAEIDGISTVDLLEQSTGVQMPPGYGLLAHWANRRLKTVPSQAVGFCGILEYISGRLIGSPLSKSDPSCLGPFGAFDAVSSTFDAEVLHLVFGYDNPRFLDPSPPFSIAGYTNKGVAVTYPVGDNQAGFFGMVSQWENSALISIGTSGQISLFSRSSDCPPSMELRPFLGQGYLHVGATLTAGKAYETLQKLLISVVHKAGFEMEDEQMFALMKEEASLEATLGALHVDTRFNGSRKEPHKRGVIDHIDVNNLSLGNLVLATVEGIMAELHAFGDDNPAVFAKMKNIVALGSAIRKNHLFRQALQRRFDLPTIVPTIEDGAAYGAALIGAVASQTASLDDVRTLVHAALGT